MFLGFAVLLQFGGALAQYSTIISEPLTLNWRYLHKAVQVKSETNGYVGLQLFLSQVLGLTFVVVAFICGVLIIPDGHYHFQSVHGSLGMIVFLLLLVQAFLGFL